MSSSKKWKSILQKDDGSCFLCSILHGDQSRKEVEKHHIFGGNRWRSVSEKNGFYVNLCIEHHRTGSEAVHDSKRSGEMKQILFEACEKKYLETNSLESWMQLMGKSWI